MTAFNIFGGTIPLMGDLLCHGQCVQSLTCNARLNSEKLVL